MARIIGVANIIFVAFSISVHVPIKAFAVTIFPRRRIPAQIVYVPGHSSTCNRITCVSFSASILLYAAVTTSNFGIIAPFIFGVLVDALWVCAVHRTMISQKFTLVGVDAHGVVGISRIFVIITGGFVKTEILARTFIHSF